MAFQVPYSCTLPTAERPVRLDEFTELLGSARSSERDDLTHLTVYFDNADGLADRARNLAARESSCCSFFDFTVAANAGDVIVGIRVPDQHSAILDSLESRSGQHA